MRPFWAGFLVYWGFVENAATLTPSAIEQSQGTRQGGITSVQSADGRLLRVYSNGRGNVDLTFVFPANSAAMAQMALRLRSSSDVYELRALNGQGQWISIQQISGTGTKTVSAAIPAGSTRLKLVAGPNADDATVDYVAFVDGVAPPAPSPTPKIPIGRVNTF